ncbi:hypothetical protein VZC37_02965 [Gordonia sp. LSe1-13]|uniref:Uncharacterized protein n=1 Tax=Gordonia sesuvii TaxID=3116777 RepID=A0ABU7M863_9ACTN|nr:hypothetical protein [Gordonia sp. LSe1-13]
MTGEQPTTVTMYWIPLGAGNRIVPFCGRTYEWWRARREHRRPSRLVHAALVAEHCGRTYTIEQAPAWGSGSGGRGVTVCGAVGLARLGRFRLFRYEIRCCVDGTIPDLTEAVAQDDVATDAARTGHLIDLARCVPAHTWGRDEIHAGDMWNSNSVVAWLLARSHHDITDAAPPDGFRAPGWRAGLVAASIREGPEPGWSRPQP